MSIQSNLAVMRNPFSTATTTPKVGDGKIGHSVGSREGIAVQVSDPNGEICFILSPGLNSSLQAITNNKQGETPDIEYFDNTLDQQLSNTGKKLPSNPDRYRLVSAGVRLTCINNSENNNGWFEAIRVPMSYSTDAPTAKDDTDIDLVGSTFDVITGNVGNMVVNPDCESKLRISRSWAIHPSYVTGKLRNLEKHLFYLQPTGDRDVVLNLDSTTQFDKSFDVVMIRIHAAASTDATQQLTVMAHCVSNWELNFDANNPRSRYHSPSYNNMMAVARNDKFIKRDPKASTIRNASSYGYSFR